MKDNNTTEKILSRLPEPLLAWYHVSARDLPWRHTDDPYRIWVSEIMLQQTRVAAVLGYYPRFLSAFPTAASLADASEERLFKLWEGLGYYSRARNLQKAARIVEERYGGIFPRTYQALLTLPGVGDYTASAIASAAFGQREAAVDGNVLRIFTRITDCHDDVTDLKTRRAVRTALNAVMPYKTEEIRIFNQATMELGATVCVPNGSPKCGECPAADFCLGRMRNTAETLPVKAPKKERKVEEKTVFLLQNQEGGIALQKRPDSGLLAGLWEFPNVPGALDAGAAEQTLRRWGMTPRDWRKRLTSKHIFTHVEWRMTGYSLLVSGAAAGFSWVNHADLDRLAVPSAFAKYLTEARALLGAPQNETSK